MNKLARDKRIQIISLLTEGMSLRAVTRTTGVSINTVTKLLVDAGQACDEFQGAALRNLKCRRVQVDEIWAFCYAKQKNVPEEHRGEYGYGDVWTWTAICADTKLVPSWLVGERTADDAYAFMLDPLSGVSERIQLSADGYRLYVRAVDATFGSDVDFAQIHKVYGNAPAGSREERRYSPAICTGADKKVLSGAPDMAKVSTSYVERQNLTIRMGSAASPA